MRWADVADARVLLVEGQLAVLGRSPASRAIRAMAAKEKDHLDAFDKLVVDRRVRPTALAPPAPEVACASELMPPERMQMMEKDTAKFENWLMRRSSSCAYPMECRTCMSSCLSESE